MFSCDWLPRPCQRDGRGLPRANQKRLLYQLKTEAYDIIAASSLDFFHLSWNKFVVWLLK